MWISCVKDEGGPRGIGFQEQVSRDDLDESTYCLIQECSRTAGRCLTKMFLLPHWDDTAASVAAPVSRAAAPKTSMCATSLRQDLMRRWNVRS